MYTQQDYNDISAQLKKRSWLMMGLPALPALAIIVYSVITRTAWLTQLTTCVLGCYLLFVRGLFIAPVAAYKQHLTNVMQGRVRTYTGAFKEMEEEKVLRDGVYFYPMLINVGRMQDEEDDRLFYYDANLTLPPWQVGDRITVTAHDKALGKWEWAENKEHA
ncbi:MAG: hypothetical protein E7324_03225 [Clostridiales bacterium]|nr:hypothetical protein [Clostridiales bacterium]